MGLDMMMMMIVSLIAVMQDVRDRCVKAKISCANWDQNNRYHEQCSLLFMAMKHIIQLAFRDHLQVMYETRIFKRIMMDETHVSLTHRDFQLDMKKLILTLRTMSMQVILLTTMVPPSTELWIALTCVI